MFRWIKPPARRDRRRPVARVRLAPEILEDRDVPAALSGVEAVVPARPAAVSILFPVFTPAEGVATKIERAPVGILFPVFEPTGYTNPCFRPVARPIPTSGR